jgi:hypothetical protein
VKDIEFYSKEETLGLYCYLRKILIENLIFMIIIVGTSTYLYFKVRQLQDID